MSLEINLYRSLPSDLKEVYWEQLQGVRKKYSSKYEKAQWKGGFASSTLWDLAKGSADRIRNPEDLISIALGALASAKTLLDEEKTMSDLPVRLNSLDFRIDRLRVSLMPKTYLRARRIDEKISGQITCNVEPAARLSWFFIPPELITGHQEEDTDRLRREKSYVWCIATMIHQLWTKDHIFPNFNSPVPFHLLKIILEEPYRKPFDIDPTLGKFLEAALTKDPAKRPNLDEAKAMFGKVPFSLYFLAKKATLPHLHGDPKVLNIPQRIKEDLS